MTLSVPSFLAAATSLLIPPPAETEATVDQLVPPPEFGEELDPEHPAASIARAVIPISANRCGDLTRMPPVSFPNPTAAVRKAAPRNVRRSVGLPRRAAFTPCLKRLASVCCLTRRTVSRDVTELTPPAPHWSYRQVGTPLPLSFRRLERGALYQLHVRDVVVRRAKLQQAHHQRAAHGPVIHPDGGQRRVEQFGRGQIVVTDDRDATPDRQGMFSRGLVNRVRCVVGVGDDRCRGIHA